MISPDSKIFMDAVKGALGTDGENIEININKKEQLIEVLNMAREQSMLPIVGDFIAGTNSYERFQKEIAPYKRQTILLMISQTQRTSFFFEIYKKLLQNEIKPVVVKGIVLRNLYPKPDCRYSNDEDLLINKDDFMKCHEILKKEGFICENDVENMDKKKIPYEVAYYNSITKVRIEIHTDLLPSDNNAFKGLNNRFKKAMDKAEKRDVGTGWVWTLNETDHFLFLLSHSYKHFIYCGFGVRQLCDLLMFAKKYNSLINWDYVETVAQENRLYRFLINLFDIGDRYLGFNCSEIPLKDRQLIVADSENLLVDMLDSGTFGKSSMGRIHSSKITMSAADKGFSEENKKVRLSVKSSLFPPKSYMKQKYQYLQKRSYLLPVAYCHRIIRYLKQRKTQSRYSKEIDSIAMGKKRMELMRQYGVL